MINSIQKDSLKDNWLNKIISENLFCCAMCIGSLEKEIAKEGIARVLGSSNTLSSMEEKKRYRRFSTMNPILKGKILELIINNLKNIDPFDQVDIYRYSRFLSYLERFFSKAYLKEVLNGCYMGSVFNAWQKKERLHEKEIKKKNQDIKKQKRINFLKKDWEHSKRFKQKKGRDLNRIKFLKEFRVFSPVEKLELILQDEMEFPYQSIPDDCLFEVSLITRRQIQKRFKASELNILRIKFGASKRRNKRSGWVRILRGL